VEENSYFSVDEIANLLFEFSLPVPHRSSVAGNGSRDSQCHSNSALNRLRCTAYYLSSRYLVNRYLGNRKAENILQIAKTSRNTTFTLLELAGPRGRGLSLCVLARILWYTG